MTKLPAELPRIEYHTHRVRTDDGVDLCVQSAGAGPAVLLVNGIGVCSPGLDFVAAQLLPRQRVISWDYRGMGQSRLDRWPVAMDMPRHARDGLRILDALGEPAAAVLGWSMGVPVALEMIRAAPARVAALGALFGAPGQPFRTAFPRPVAALVHAFVHLARVAPQPAQALLDGAVMLPEATWAVCTLTGFCGRTAHRAIWEEHVRSTRNADKRAYFGSMAAMMEHDASDVLPAVRCPTLVVAGANDWVTPPRAAAAMAATIPGARLVTLPATSHFGVIEHGPELWEPLDALLAAAGWDGAAAGAAAGPRR
ncbi:MAG TPA: alpha/beta hydrolase [Polyangia bacterium]|jgi:pimeloyl-ACP methyl ester carboxylesterase